ncbi:MAG TPA: energy-coupling factor ABC transporter ATP-binding protein [Bryobacteraceae bacterium]|nr:energy-coupling factor ABC transporter ATP-binding protein [Bryobacteraceae bacterium]
MMLFEIERLTYRYEGVTAVDDLTLAIPEGCRVALLGANGSGKSTLLRLLDGLIFGQSGTILFRGDDVSEQHMLDDEWALPFRRTVGMVFQNPDVQLFNPTVFDEVAFGPLQLRWPKDQIRERVDEILDRLRISQLKNRIPQRLSGGEKKRVALASVLVLDPAVLLLDEPTAALDPRSQSEVIDLMVEWGGSKSVITATHDLGDLEDIADRCYVLDGGKLVAEGTPAEILADTALLRRTNLIHAHRHKRGEEVHTHSQR